MTDARKKSTNVSDAMLDDILRLASLSPSSHNTQPWKVHVENGRSVVVGYHPDRQLKVGDPHKRELFISLGCFIESICLVAEDHSYSTAYTFLGTEPSSVARLQFLANSNTQAREKEWSALIRQRRSDRRLYEQKRLSPQTVADLGALSNSNAQLVIVDQPADIKYLATMTRDATLELMTPYAFREELASWVRNNWTKKPDGMPGYTQGMPGPISLLAKFVIKKNKGVATDQAKKDGKRVAHSGAIGLVCVASESPAIWIEAGRLHQRACLEALRRNIKTSAVSAAVILPSTTQKIVRQLGLRGIPVALLRLGYKDGTPKAAPRLNIEEIKS